MYCIYILYSTKIFTYFFFNDTATTEIYTLSLHDALPIFESSIVKKSVSSHDHRIGGNEIAVQEILKNPALKISTDRRSEEHTSELQSRLHLVCRLLLEKKKYD